MMWPRVIIISSLTVVMLSFQNCASSGMMAYHPLDAELVAKPGPLPVIKNPNYDGVYIDPDLLDEVAHEEDEAEEIGGASHSEEEPSPSMEPETVSDIDSAPSSESEKDSAEELTGSEDIGSDTEEPDTTDEVAENDEDPRIDDELRNTDYVCILESNQGTFLHLGISKRAHWQYSNHDDRKHTDRHEGKSHNERHEHSDKHHEDVDGDEDKIKTLCLSKLACKLLVKLKFKVKKAQREKVLCSRRSFNSYKNRVVHLSDEEIENFVYWEDKSDTENKAHHSRDKDNQDKHEDHDDDGDS